MGEKQLNNNKNFCQVIFLKKLIFFRSKKNFKWEKINFSDIPRIFQKIWGIGDRLMVENNIDRVTTCSTFQNSMTFQKDF